MKKLYINKLGDEMKKIEPYPVANALFFTFGIFYSICLGFKFVLIQFGAGSIWNMHKLWYLILPGYTGMNIESFILGLFEVTLGAYLIAFIVVPIYNFLIRNNDSVKEENNKPVKVRFKVLFLSLATFGFIIYTISFAYDLGVLSALSFNHFWHYLLPGVNGLSSASFLIGIIDIFIYSLYAAFIFSGTLNYFERIKILNVKNPAGQGVWP